MVRRFLRPLVGSSVLLLLLHCAGGPSSPTGNPDDPDASTDPSRRDGATASSDATTSSDAATSADDAGACPSYTASEKACTGPADCAIVGRGCHCGRQPLIGVAKALATRATACETKRQAECVLGCANAPGHVAEDGNSDVDGGTIAVECASNQCRTVLQ